VPGACGPQPAWPQKKRWSIFCPVWGSRSTKLTGAQTDRTALRPGRQAQCTQSPPRRPTVRWSQEETSRVFALKAVRVRSVRQPPPLDRARTPARRSRWPAPRRSASRTRRSAAAPAPGRSPRVQFVRRARSPGRRGSAARIASNRRDPAGRSAPTARSHRQHSSRRASRPSVVARRARSRNGSPSKARRGMASARSGQTGPRRDRAFSVDRERPVPGAALSPPVPAAQDGRWVSVRRLQLPTVTRSSGQRSCSRARLTGRSIAAHRRAQVR